MDATGTNLAFFNGKARRGAIALPLLAVLAASLLAGCSRTYDGTIVPTYQFALSRSYGIPMVMLEPTPLDPPARHMPFPEPPRVSPSPALAQPSRPVRQAKRRAAAPPQPAKPTVLNCERVSPPSVGRVVMSCG